ncbi:tyrosine-type recombinase/integrase [Nocardioides sp.]
MSRNPLQPGEIGKIRTVQIRPGLWRADASYCDRSGTKGRCRKTGRTETASRRALADELKERIEFENLNSLVTTASLVNEAVDIYLMNRMDDARNGIGRANPRSVKIYRSVAENWIKPILGELQVRQLTPGRLDTYFRNDVPPTRYADVRKILHAFIKWLVVQGALRRDPVTNLQSYQRKNIQKRSKDREFTIEDLKTVLAAIEGWMTRKRPGPRPSTNYRDLVLLIAGTACRPGEALALRRCDIDLNCTVAPGTTKPVAHITGTVVYDAELGGLLRQPHTKGHGAGDRTVILPTFVAAMLRERMMAAAPNENDAIFATRTGNWLSLNNINTRLRDSILKDTDVGAWFELRLLRSATGTVVANEFGAEAAAAQMGNTREIAESHYIHKSRLAPDRAAQIQDAWGTAFGS